MEELYWITRLNVINASLIAVMLISAMLAITLFIAASNSKSDSNDFIEGSKFWKISINTYKRYLYLFKRCVIIFVASAFMEILIPTTNEALLIYGVGGTIDYIKSNETAKQLPDKCIKALNKWADNLNEEETKRQ